MKDEVLGNPNADDNICGKNKADIRKAFFKGKLNKLLDEVSASSKISIEETQKLEKYLLELKEEKDKNRSFTDKFESESKIKPPSVDELRTELDEEQKEKLKAWVSNAEDAENYIKRLMGGLRADTKNGMKLNKNVYADIALEIITMVSTVDQLRVYRDQLYREQLTKLIDNYNISRAEAEERAKLTKEYRDYKTACLFKENVEEFIMMAKKRFSIDY